MDGQLCGEYKAATAITMRKANAVLHHLTLLVATHSKKSNVTSSTKVSKKSTPSSL
jgi:hypothetical protein